MAGTRRYLLDIVKDAGADIGVLGGITELSNTNTEQRMVNAAIRRTGTDLCRAGLLVREHSFYTASGTSIYEMPADYFLPWTNTTWNRSDQRRMRNIGQKEKQARQSGLIASSIHQRFIIKPLVISPSLVDPGHYSQRQFHIDPTPTAAEKVVFNYRSDHWVEGLGFSAAGISAVTLSGSDEVVVTSAGHSFVVGDVVGFYGVGGTTELNSNQFTISAKDTNTITLLGTSSADFTAHTSGGSIQKIGNSDNLTASQGILWYSLLPDELVELGISWRLRQRMGMSYFEHKNEYEELKETFVGAAHGDMIINLGGGSRLGNNVGIPEGNFPSS